LTFVDKGKPLVSVGDIILKD